MNKPLCTFGALLLIAVTPTTVAQADTVDDDFVNSLADQGITNQRDQLIAAGHMICNITSGIATNLPARLTRVLPVSYAMTALQLPTNQAVNVVDAALNIYCPQYLRS